MASTPSLDHQLARLAATTPVFRDLLERDAADQHARGYFHTLREIAQQPATWTATAAAMAGHAVTLRAALDDGGILDRQGAVVLTGSGSSLYVGESSAPFLQEALGVPVSAVGGGDILTHADAVLPPGRPLLIVSVARSGNSPESCGVVDLLLERRPDATHLAITCCADGRLATRYVDERRVRTIVLDQATCDRSLVMTSSFTNLALAARALAFTGAQEDFDQLAGRLAATAQQVLSGHARRLAEIGGGDFGSAIFLGSGDSFGTARESALKMLEMTAGRVKTFAETFLGLRHGPMSAVHEDTLLVCYLSSVPKVRAYERDLLEEIGAKGVHPPLVIVGENIPDGLADGGGTLVECPGLASAGDGHAPLVHVIVGQLLAFFRCLRLGLKPDEPSSGHIITRVVSPFRIHRS